MYSENWKYWKKNLWIHPANFEYRCNYTYASGNFITQNTV